MANLRDHPLTIFIGHHDGLAERLIAAHSDDGRGRCAACLIGAQAGNQPWPCTIRRCAEVAGGRR